MGRPRPPAPSASPAGTFTVSGSHTYAEESAADHPGSDPYDITVTISHHVAPDAVVHSPADVSDPAVVATGGFTFVAVEDDPSAAQPVATFTDPGGAEPLGDYSAVIDWGDGTTSVGTITAGFGGVFTVSGSHTFAVGLGTPSDFGNSFCDADPPSYHKPITVTVSHEAAPTAQAGSDAEISLKPGSAHLAAEGSLIVVGTPADDSVVINNVGGNTRTVTVQLGSGVLGTFTVGPAGRIVVAAMGGNDSVQVAGGITVETVLYGGPGNDRLKGGGDRNILIGCEGDDTLLAGNLGDLMVGGAGADRLVGGNGDDQVVAGLLLDGDNNEDDRYDDLVAIRGGRRHLRSAPRGGRRGGRQADRRRRDRHVLLQLRGRRGAGHRDRLVGGPVRRLIATATVGRAGRENRPAPFVCRPPHAVARFVEGNGGPTTPDFTVTLSAPSTQTMTVDFALAGGSAMLADTDYGYANGTGALTFAPAATQQRIALLINGDRKPEQDETFLVNLSNPPPSPDTRVWAPVGPG